MRTNAKSETKAFTKRVEEDRHSTVITYKVTGFWSDNYIEVQQHASLRNWRWKAPTLRRSSGGTEGENTLEAEMNFVEAMQDAIAEIKRLLPRVGQKV